ALLQHTLCLAHDGVPVLRTLLRAGAMSEVAGPVVAAFDFDGTLTRRDTLLPFLARGLGWPRFLRALLLSGPWMAGYALKLVRNDVAKARLLKMALAGRSSVEVAHWAADWA